MAHRNFPLVQIFNAERIAERARQLFEFQNFFGVGLFVHAMERFDAALQDVTVYCAIGGQHEFFNQAMRDVPFAAHDAGHALLVIEFDHLFGEVEIDGAVLVASRVQEQRQLFHIREVLHKRRVARGHFGIALDHFIHVGVGHPFERANHAGSHARGAACFRRRQTP